METMTSGLKTNKQLISLRKRWQKHATTVGHSAWHEIPGSCVFLAGSASLSTFFHVLEVAFGTARWEPLQIFKDSLRLVGVYAETCSQFPAPVIVNPVTTDSQPWVCEKYELHVNWNSVCTRKKTTQLGKRIGNVRERKLEAAILQEANSGPQVTFE